MHGDGIHDSVFEHYSNVEWNIKNKAEAGWLTGKACQLFDNLKHKYNPNDKLLRVQMMKKLKKIKPKKSKDPKVMCRIILKYLTMIQL